MPFIQDPAMTSLVSQKRIAVIGPSPHILHKKTGPYIDGHDLVCRINDDIFPTGYEEDYGSRTDILSFSGDSRFIDNAINNFQKNKDIVKNIKIVFLSTIKAQHDWGGSVVDNFNKVNKSFNRPYFDIGRPNYELACNYFGCEPNSGQMTVWMFLQYPIKELFITGFSFYNQFSETGDNQSSFYNHDLIYSKKPLPSSHSPTLGHNQDVQKTQFTNLIRRHQERVVIDPYLDKLLSLNHPSVSNGNARN